MKSILKATAVLSSASAVSIAVGLVSAKINAVLLGPEGLGYMGLLQGLVGLAALFAGMGVGSGLVRAGAKALADEDLRRVAALRRGAWLLCWTLGGAGVVLMILLRAPLSRVMLGGGEHTGAVVLMCAALLFGLASAVQTGLLNAHHRIGDLARISMLSSLLGVPLGLLLIWLWRERGVPLAVLAGFSVNWAVSYYFVRGGRYAPAAHLPRAEVFAATRALLHFGVPFTGSMLVGAGVQMLMPVLVLHALSRADVGFYRAAAAVAVNYLSFLLTAMGQDFYPRVSAASDRPAALTQLVNEQQRLVLLLAGPIIVGMLALVPYLVPLIYSPQFSPAIELLEWQLIGDLFRFAIWPASMVILTRNGSTTFFLTELAGGTCLLLTSWLGMHWFGLAGLGMAFTFSAILHFSLCVLILWRTLRLRWATENKLLFAMLVLFAFIVRVLPYAGFGSLRTPVALTLASVAGLGSAYILWGAVGGLKGLLAWRKSG